MLTFGPDWTSEETNLAQTTVVLKTWKAFGSYVRSLANGSDYVWRGQQDAAWKLESSFDRLFVADTFKEIRQTLAERHLSRFKIAARGRKAVNLLPATEDAEWWAVAQHNGMKTPLLDWTESPYIALYFAFEKNANTGGGKRAVWALSRPSQGNAFIRPAPEPKRLSGTKLGTLQDKLVFVTPMLDGNARLTGQAGLFTQVPYGEPVEDWIANKPENTEWPRLLKIELPEDLMTRDECIADLSSMNISHLTLFPDLYGAGKSCNEELGKNVRRLGHETNLKT